ncbi:hypothetical protein MMC30_008623 [Trapelia coarctata]|nr:hypothetical protein [Trapelia coarctata]
MPQDQTINKRLSTLPQELGNTVRLFVLETSHQPLPGSSMQNSNGVKMREPGYATKEQGEKGASKLTTAVADFPSYNPPRKGFLSILPPSWVPYAELMRLERPAGLYAFYFPYIIGICYAACITDPTPSLTHMAALSCLFLAGNVILRGAACAWNDNIDQDFDRKVARCRLRPIARGAVTTTQGHIFTAALTLAGLPLFAYLPPRCAYHASPIAVLFGLYPFAKRVTYYPQVVLGFPFAWAIFLCCAALNVNPFGNRFLLPTASLFMANVLWTITYDTIYAHQDINDDVKAGVKSMAVRFAQSTKLLASTLSVIQIGLLILTGWLAELSPIYYVGACGGTGIALASMILLVDLSKPASCAWWFHWDFWFVGGSIAGGLFAEYLAKLVGMDPATFGVFQL